MLGKLDAPVFGLEISMIQQHRKVSMFGLTKETLEDSWCQTVYGLTKEIDALGTKEDLS